MFKIKRGLQENLPVLEDGELGFTEDTRKLYVGSQSGNTEFIPGEEIDAKIQASMQDVANLNIREQSLLERLQAEISQRLSGIDSVTSGINSGLQGLANTLRMYVTKVQLDGLESSLKALIDKKAPKGHEHPDYATKEAVKSFRSDLEDIKKTVDQDINIAKAPLNHRHKIPDINGLQDALDNAGGGAVDSVNGKTGVVTLDTSEVPEATDFRYLSDAQKAALATYVVGPSSATNTAIAIFDLTTGKLIKNTGVLIDALNNMLGVTADFAAANIVDSATQVGTLNVRSTDAQAVDRGGTITLGGYSDNAASAVRVFGSVNGRKENGTTGNSSGYLIFKTNNAGTLTGWLRISSTGVVSPNTDDASSLGSTSLSWSDLFLASGAVINFNNSNVVLTHSTGVLTMGTGDFRITTAGTNSASVVTVGGTQTLTNKTLTSPAITTPTGIVKGDVGLGNVDNTSDATKNAASVTLTNKTISTGSILSGLADESFSLYGLARQGVINGNFDIWQENTTFTTPNDDTYIADCWNSLSEANGSWTFIRDTDVPTTGSRYSVKATNVTANNQCGIVQFISAENTKKLVGRTVSLSFQAKTVSTEIANLRATVLAWTGTADAVTSDVVGTWAQNGTDPTWATNWTSEKAGSNLALSASYQTFKVENILLDTASTNNLAIVIWVDDGTITTGDDFWISQVQMNVGTTALPFQPLPFGEEYEKCLDFFRTSYAYGTVVPTTLAANYEERFVPSSTYGTVVVNQEYCRVVLDRPMVITPTLTVYPFTTVANTGRVSDSSGTDLASGSGGQARVSTKGFTVFNNSAGSISVANNKVIFHWKLDGRL